MGLLGRDESSSVVKSESAEGETSEAEAAGTEKDAGSGEESTEIRTELNLLGQTDTASGESRRNENVQFNLIDNNAAKDLSIRLGPKATLIEEFDVNRSYFGAEFGDSPTTPLHLEPKPFAGIHGNLYETHNNSVFSARSFFQAGGVKPAQGKRVRVRCGGSALERRKVLPRRQPTENTGQCEWKRPCPPSRRADSSD